MRTAMRLRTALAGFTTIVMSAQAAPEPALQCPQSIEQKSVQLINAPAGWATFVHKPLYLHGAAPMSGPPNELGELADYSEKREKGAMVYTYKLDAPFPAGKWLSCTYGEGDQISLGMKLADNIKVCTFRYKKGTHVGENNIAISCQ
jgi:hypothetical protein